MDKQKLISILRTLNNIEVHGKQNMDRLLGCIQAIESMLTESEEKESDE